MSCDNVSLYRICNGEGTGKSTGDVHLAVCQLFPVQFAFDKNWYNFINFIYKLLVSKCEETKDPNGIIPFA